MKRSLSFILSLVMVIGIIASVPVTVNAASVDNLTFEYLSYDDSYTVKKCNTSVEGKITIPATYKGLPVTEIYPEAFAYCENLTEISMPDSIEWMGVGVFEGCKNLERIKLSNGLRRIPDMAFNFCSALISVELPITLEEIGVAAFQGCTSLTSIDIPESVTSIGDAAFWSCTSLKSVTIPDSASVSERAFRYCIGLKSINVGKNNESCASIDGVLFNKEKTALLQYPAQKTGSTYKIPSGVTDIKDSAFYGCANLKSVEFPKSVSNIEQMAFYWCASLESVKIGNGVTYIGDQAFSTCTNLESVYISKSVTSIADAVFLGCTNLKKITVADENEHYTAVNGVLFDKAKTALIAYPIGKTDKFYIIPSGVKIIYMGAFALCGNLEKVTIPDTVKTISEAAFAMCLNLKSVNIPSSVTKIGEMAFGYVISDTADFEKVEGFTIYGVKGSEAQAYAKANGFTFKTACAHKSTKWVTDKKATVYKAGSKHKECTTCGEVLKAAKIAQLKCSKPTLKTISNTEYGVKITWGTVKGADKYYIYRKTSNGSYSRIGSTTNTYYTDKTAKSGTKYYYIVKAINEAGASASSSALSKYYLADPTLNTPSSSSKGVGLRWSKVTGATGYMVYRKEAGGSYKKIATEKGVSNVTYRDTTAKKGTKYYYKVKAYKSKTYSAYSNTKSITDKY